MPFQVVQSDEGFIAGVGDGLCDSYPDEQCADQPGAVCNSYCVQISKLSVRLGKRIANHLDDILDVLATCYFRNHAPELAMVRDL